jgi:hypothetical protein
MKKLTVLFTMMLMLAALQAWATPVGAGSARSMVLNFLNNSSGDGTQITPPPGGIELQLVHTEVSSVDATHNAYYIYNTGGGFVIVAGDDRARGILAYGDHDLDMDNIPDGMQFMLDCYKEQIDYLLSNPGLVVQTPVLYATAPTATAVEPMLTALWNQDVPYNNMVPVHEDKPCMTGCSCTALCQVMYYWQHPLNATPSVPEYTTATNRIFMPELPPTTFDWDNMLESYSDSYTQAQADAVAQLMLYVGQAEKMNYGPRPKGSTAHILLIRKAAQMLGYNPDSEVISKKNSGYSDAEWEELMLNELYAGRPIIYTSKDSIKKVAHAFDIDGYDGEKYHINWGWGGNSNGYFAFRAFNTSSYQFNTEHLMIVGLEPAYSEIEVSHAELSFNAATGSVQQQTFIVSGIDLTGDLKLELNDESGCFSIDKTAISLDAAAAGETITVTYSPSSEGESHASVTISGSCAEEKTVNLSGKAETPEPSLHVSKSVVAFNNTDILLGTGSTQTINIQGANLANNLELSISGGDSSAFMVAKTTITPEEAAGGVNVSLRFKPSSAGVNKSTLQIKTGGGKIINVQLIGIGVNYTVSNDGYISANPSSLTLETQVGTPVTQTFRVCYTPNGSNGGGVIMAGNPNGSDNSGNDDGNSPNMVTLRPSANDKFTVQNGVTADLLKIIIKPGDLFPITPIVINSGIDLVGDNCFSITPNNVTAKQLKNGIDITVTYNPSEAGSHEAYLGISMPFVSLYRATPILVHLTGIATDGEVLMAPQIDNEDTEEILELEPYGETNESLDYSATGIDDMMVDVKIYADGQDIIIETPVDQSAIISDITGRARRVNLRAGYNAIPVNASGVHIVRVGNQTAKLLLR